MLVTLVQLTKMEENTNIYNITKLGIMLIKVEL